MFRAAEDVYPPTSQHPEHSAAEACVWMFWRHHAQVPAPLHRHLKGTWPVEVHPDLAAYAYVNHGRWLVDCVGCNSAQYASRLDHRFFCVHCDRSAGRWVPVIWPSETDVDLIEAALSRVPVESMRNWNLGETVEDLLAQLARAGF